MDNKKAPNQQELKVELTPEVASGTYSNLAFISHSPSEVCIDFLSLLPRAASARVLSRIIMTPENAKNLLAALSQNIQGYEATFGEIKPRTPIQPANPGEIRSPFMQGGNA